MDKKRILIIGGGAGGLELATRLGDSLGKKQLADIVLVDANSTHLWKPRLHEVASGVMNSNLDELDYSAHAYQHHFKFVLGRMRSLDRQRKTITLDPLKIWQEEILDSRNLSYDILVIAVGSTSNDFGTKGAREHCIFLDSRESAEHLRQNLLNFFYKAEQSKNRHRLNIVIIGAGATGVELAAELNHAVCELNKYGFNGVVKEDVSIHLIEGADRVMPVLKPRASMAISKQLDRLNIKVHTQERVTQVETAKIKTVSGKNIPYDICVWSAGVKAPEFLKKLDGLETNKANQIIVDSTLRSVSDGAIFAFGDCAQNIPKNMESPVSPRAQVASQQAKHLARSLIGFCKGKPLGEFSYHDNGSLISLSSYSSVGQIMGSLSGGFTFEGKLARLFYISLYRFHQKVLHGTFKTLLLIIRDKINKKTGPTMKLH